MVIKIKKLSDSAKIPTQNCPIDAGYDLYSAENGWIRPHERKLFKTDISIAIPENYYGRVADRSGNAYKLGLHCLAGVVDSGFLGNVGVILYNTNGGGEENSIKIEKGQRIAQLIIEKCHKVEWEEVSGGLGETVRGENGYGSSGT